MKQIKPAQSYIDESRAQALLEKWAPVLDYTSKSVAPIEDEHTRLNTAMLLENQEAYCLREANTVGGTGGIFGSGTDNGATGNAFPGGSDSYATGDARLPKILIPMIRRTFPELITNEIVGVQPMAGPVGLAFALRYKYSNQTLGGNYQDASQNGSWQAAPGTHTQQSVGYTGTKTPQGDNELGFQHLDTRYTGASSAALSGNSEWAFAAQDGGVAEILKNFEINANIPTVEVSFEKTAVEAGTRRLGAKWSVELEQDLKNKRYGV